MIKGKKFTLKPNETEVAKHLADSEIIQKKRADRNYKAHILSGYIALAGFVIGLILLLLFVAVNTWAALQ